jgi:hypothetical protein
MDKIQIALLVVIALAIILLAYMVLTTYVFRGPSGSYTSGSGGGIAIGGPGGCVSSSGSCPQPGSAGPGQYLSH